MSDVTRSIRWLSPNGSTIEHCVVKLGSASIAAEGLIIGGTGDAEYGLRYRIVVDAEWAGFRSLHITRLGGATLALRHDGYGEWTDGEGKKRPDLSKCLDVDLAGSRFGFSTTAKRLAWKAGKSVDLPTIRIEVPSLEVAAVTTRVTAVEPGRHFRLSRPTGDAEEVSLDADGLVTLAAETAEQASSLAAV